MTHPKELYELVKLVRSWLESKTGYPPDPQAVALCLAGAYGLLSGLGQIDDSLCANIQEQARKNSETWKGAQ